jgi:hypothetical protein
MVGASVQGPNEKIIEGYMIVCPSAVFARRLMAILAKAVVYVRIRIMRASLMCIVKIHYQ